MSRSVLIIDDNARTRARLRDALEQEGLQVVERDPCGRPTEHTVEPEHAVILIDVVMPEKDGFEYLRDIRRLWPQQRLVLYSAGLSDYTHYAVKLGADAGIDIASPARLRELVETARRLASDARAAGDRDRSAGPLPRA